MNATPVFPTSLHIETAEQVRNFFLPVPGVDTILVVNSCARGQAVSESDLDFAILVQPNISVAEVEKIETQWKLCIQNNSTISRYLQSHSFCRLHVDIITGEYTPATWDDGGGPDFFEVEIGNQICYAAPFGKTGAYFSGLQKSWLPYYNESLRLQRLTMVLDACKYDLDHIPFFIKRGLHFQAFDRLYKAFQEFLQALFIAHKTYPIAYNKWIREQIEKWLNLPDLYPKLSPVISVKNIETNELNEKAFMLHELLAQLTNS